MKKIASRFIGFFTRSVAPSSIFFMLLFFNDYYFNSSKLYKFMSHLREIVDIDNILLYVVIIMIFLAYGYVNQILCQFQDEFIKSDYTICDNEFINLREKVISSLKEKEIFNHISKNDYNLYQVLGSDNKVSTSYADFTKSVHTISTAISLNIIIYLYSFSDYENDINFLILLLIVPVLLLSYLIAQYRYKSRNKKMYINYLLKK